MKTMIFSLAALSLMAVLLIRAGKAMSDTEWLSAEDDQDEAYERVHGGEILPLAEILERHAPRVQGRLLDAELESEDGRMVYELEVLDADSRIRELSIDAVSGKLLSSETED